MFFKWSRISVGLLLLAPQVSASSIRFESHSPARTRIQWVHENGRSDRRYLPETMGAGVAALDFDQDGWVDLYFVNSGPCDFFQPPEKIENGLFRNLGDGRFENVTSRAGVGGGTFGMGAAAGDYDNDGFPDLVVTSYGPVLLFHNDGDGSFSEVGASAGIEVRGWTTSAVWLDFNEDGRLDLFLCSFVRFARNLHISCGLNPLGKTYYCVPRVFDASPSYLFENLGDGRFRDVSDETGVKRSPGKSLGVVAGDINADGWIDLFVANDTVQDFLFVNREGKRFEEIGLYAGVGFSLDGAAQSGMGVDAADFDEDGDLDLFVSNIDHQNDSLFRNNGDETFTDLTLSEGLSESTFLLSGWGSRFLDLDLDGDLDLFIVHGHPDDMIDEYAPEVSYREPALVFQNRDGHFREVSRLAGRFFLKEFSSRGLASADLNNDGLVDVVVSNNGGRPLVLRNTSRTRNHWLGVRLVGRTSNRDGVGARVLWKSGAVLRSRYVTSGGSYLSSHDLRLILGLGKSTALEWVEVRWPGPARRVERFIPSGIDRYVELVEGTGQSVSH